MEPSTSCHLSLKLGIVLGFLTFHIQSVTSFVDSHSETHLEDALSPSSLIPPELSLLSSLSWASKIAS